MTHLPPTLTPTDIDRLADRIIAKSPVLSGARWLKANHAATYSAIGIHNLKRLAADPDSAVIGYKDPGSKRGDWIFDRESLDEYRQLQSGARHTQLKVVDILRRHPL